MSPFEKSCLRWNEPTDLFIAHKNSLPFALLLLSLFFAIPVHAVSFTFPDQLGLVSAKNDFHISSLLWWLYTTSQRCDCIYITEYNQLYSVINGNAYQHNDIFGLNCSNTQIYTQPTTKRGNWKSSNLYYSGDSCKYKMCPEGSTCQSTDGSSHNQGKCVCIDQCPEDTNPQHTDRQSFVCGSDGRTYSSLCELQRQSCNNDYSIGFVEDGACQSGTSGALVTPCSREVATVFCDDKESCFERNVNGNASVVCECPACSTRSVNDEPNSQRFAFLDGNSNSVCGSDGNTYNSECLLRRHACLVKTSIYVLYPGSCRKYTIVVSILLSRFINIYKREEYLSLFLNLSLLP